jgi:hypothetical protein
MKKLIIRTFVGAVIAVNVWCGLPTIYKAPYRLVGTDVASVYDNSDLPGPYVAIKRVEADKFLDTGKRVSVFIPSDYPNRGREKLAGINLIAIFAAIAFYRWQERHKKREHETVA